MRELIEKHAGGVRGGWDNLLAVIPGGSSVPMLNKETCDDVLMDFDALKEAGSGLGTAAVIVMDKSTDAVRRHRSLGVLLQARIVRAVYAVQRGHELMYNIMQRLVKADARVEEVEMLQQIT